MSYYGILKEPTDKTLETIESTVLKSFEHLTPQVDKFIDNVRDKLWSDFENFLITDNMENIRLAISRECQTIIEAFLCGDIETLKKTMILSDYTHSRLHEVRMAIFKACGDELQKTIMEELEDKVSRLKKDVEFYRERR